MAKAVIYVRISQDPTGERAGVERQRSDSLRLAADRGFTVEAVCEDNDASAYTGKRRAGWEAVCDRIREGGIDFLIVWAADRAVRHPRELEDLVELLEATDTKVATVTSGEYDLTTPEGRAYARIVGAIARQESERKSVRLVAANRHRAEKGQRMGGRRPFGYEQDGLTIRPAEAAVLRESAQRIIDGASVRSEALRLNEAGVSTTTGRRWTSARIRDVLLNPRYVGKRSYKGEVVADAEWPAVFDPAVWETLQSVLRSPKRRWLGRGRPARYWLSRVAVCGRCGTGMIGSGRVENPLYCCRVDVGGCGRVSIRANRLERVIADTILDRAGTPARRAELVAAATGTDRTEVDAIVGGIEAAERTKQEAAAMFAVRDIDREQLATISRSVDAEIVALRRRLGAIERETVLAGIDGDLTEAWDGLSVEDRRRIARALLSEVTIAPFSSNGGIFDPRRVQPVWRA
jgi:DNA invertase Pin-like site-specific DNA recombinase